MKFILEITMDNAAFEDSNVFAVAGLLGVTTNQLLTHSELKPGDEHSLRDANGNTVGSWKVVES